MIIRARLSFFAFIKHSICRIIGADRINHRYLNLDLLKSRYRFTVFNITFLRERRNFSEKMDHHLLTGKLHERFEILRWNSIHPIQRLKKKNRARILNPQEASSPNPGSMIDWLPRVIYQATDIFTTKAATNLRKLRCSWAQKVHLLFLLKIVDNDQTSFSFSIAPKCNQHRDLNLDSTQ